MIGGIRPSWDPKQYNRFADERGRPFHDLVRHIETERPLRVVDLGCGPGTMTATLGARWPDAQILGIDSAPAMIAAAQPQTNQRLTFQLGDITDWRPAPETVDVIVANASLQWVPGHLDLLDDWTAALRPLGCIAFQVPLSHDIAAMIEVRSAAASPPWADRLGNVAGIPPLPPIERYLEALYQTGLRVDAWTTTYLHVLSGPDPVLEWFTGTGLRPYLDALADDAELLAAFRDDVAARLHAAYPRQEFGTVLPFPRLFLVAHRA